MDPVQLFRTDDGFAVKLPVGLNDPDVAKVFRTFEYLVSEMSQMSQYHRNPTESGISDSEKEYRFSKYLGNHDGKIVAYFFAPVTSENFQRMKTFVEIVNISFQRGIFI